MKQYRGKVDLLLYLNIKDSSFLYQTIDLKLKQYSIKILHFKSRTLCKLPVDLKHCIGYFAPIWQKRFVGGKVCFSFLFLRI